MRSRITPSLVLSIIAVVLSLTGVGYAATQLPRDSVGSAQIKVGAVGSAEVADGSLRPADFSDAAKDALEGKRGAKGAKGDTGAQGPAGPTGPAGPAGAGGSGGGGGDLTVTDANGVVAGTLVTMFTQSGSMYVTVRSPSGVIAEYRPDSTSYVLTDLGFVVSLNADCSPPLYIRARAALPAYGVAKLPYGSTTPYVMSHDAPISPAPSSQVYVLPSSSCTPVRADAWDDPPSFVRLDPVASGDLLLELAKPLTFG